MRTSAKKASAPTEILTAKQISNAPAIRGNSLYNYDYPVHAFKLCLLGATNKELAGYFGVSAPTINTWKKFDPAFGDAITKGKKMADMEVAHSLYQASLDRIVTTRQAIKCKEIYYDENGKRVEKERIELVQVEKHIPADFRAQQFWLRNRNPKQWSLKTEEIDGPKPSVTLNLGSGQNPADDEAAG